MPHRRGVEGVAAHAVLLVTPTLGELPSPHRTLSCDQPGHTLVSWLRTLFDHRPFTVVFNLAG